jgi:ribosomal protein S18
MNFRNSLEDYSHRFNLMSLENGIELMSYKQYRIFRRFITDYFIFFL